MSKNMKRVTLLLIGFLSTLILTVLGFSYQSEGVDFLVWFMVLFVVGILLSTLWHEVGAS